MNRPSSNASPARRRITPIAVNAQDQSVSAVFAAEQPLILGPAFATGGTQDISTSGPGRRVWVDIQSTINIRFKDVLRQQGLEYATWKKDVEQRRAKLEGAPQGPDARRKGITGLLYQRTLGLYEASDEEAASDQDESDEAAPASDGAHEDGAADGDDAAGSEGDDEDDDEDDDDDKEGNETGGEIDLDKEEEAAKGSKAAKPKRQRFERYDDDFIDDSELEMVKGAAREVKTKFSGFYATKGAIEVVEEHGKPRSKPKPRAPKAPPAATDGAKADGTIASAGAGAVGKKRKQVDKLQQGADLAAPGHAAAAVNGADAGKKKRQRSEAPAAAAGAVVASGAPDKPPAPKKVKPTPVPAAGDAAAASSAAVTGGNAPAAAPVAVPGTAKLAVAAALAAKQKKRIQPEKMEVDGAQSIAAAPANGGPGAASGAVDIARPEVVAETTATGNRQQHPQVQGPQEASAAGAATAAGLAGVTAGAAPAAVDSSVYRTHDGNSGSLAGDVPDAAAAAVAAGLPADLVAAVQTLQEKVMEHKPSGKSSSMSQPVKQAVRNVGLTFLLMTGEQQQQHQDNLLQVLTPLMLPYGKDRKLRKELFEVPKKDLDDSRQKSDILMQQLEQMKQQQAAQAPDVDDDFQSAPWTSDAEQALLEAWDTAKMQQQLLQQLAVDVSEKLGWSQQPDRAVEEVRHIYNKAKKKPRKESRKDQQQQPQAPTPIRSTTPQPTSLQQQSSFSSRDATASQPASRQSPAPKSSSAAATADAGGGDRSATSNPTPHKADATGSTGTGLAAAADAGSGAAAGGGSAGTAGKKEQEKFSTCQAPSPRLQRCLEAAEASGAPHEWLADHCPKPKQPLLNQIFRVLCVAGPQGCTVKGMVAKASEHGLGFGWEDNGNQRSAITSSLQHTQGGVRMAGVTEMDPAAFALQCFKGVIPQPIKPKQPKSAAEAAAGSTQPTAAEEAGQQAAE